MLAEHPEARAFQRTDHRPHEGLVVEAGRQKLAAELVDGMEIPGQRREAVLADDHQPVINLDHGRRDIRLAAPRRFSTVTSALGSSTPAVSRPRGRWYLNERPNSVTPLASSAEASVSPAWPV